LQNYTCSQYSPAAPGKPPGKPPGNPPGNPPELLWLCSCQ